jgi:molecular chaperone DnaJ
VNDYYQTLGVARDASPEEIKRAYRQACVKHHPDVAGDTPEAEERMKQVNLAYQVLSDPERRRRFDMGADPMSAGGGEGFGGFAGSSFGDLFETLFNAAAGQARPAGPASRRQRGRDLVQAVTIDLAEAVVGAKRDIEVATFGRCQRCDGNGCEPGTGPERCAACHGQGSTIRVVRSLLGAMRTQVACPSCGGYGTTIPKPCSECAGAGRVRGRRSVPVDMPAGVETGTRVRVGGAGEAGPGGGPAGDLYIDVRVRRDARFSRDGEDLHCTLEVPMTAAALGARLTVATLDGDREVEIGPGAQPGEVVALDGLGAGRLGGGPGARGDLLVHLDIKVPRPDDEEQRQVLRRLAALRGEELPEGRLATAGEGVLSRLREKLMGK